MNVTAQKEVGTFAVLRHMLFGVVGLLLCAAGVALYVGLRPVSRPAIPGVSPIPVALAPGEVAVGRLDDRPGLAHLASQLTLTVQRATSGTRVFRIDAVTESRPLFGRSTSQAAVLVPHDPSKGPLDMESLLVEFAADLEQGLDAASSAARDVLGVRGAGGSFVTTAGSIVIPFDFDDLEGLIVQYAPPGTTTVEEWGLVEDGFGLRFERRTAPSATPAAPTAVSPVPAVPTTSSP
ncbi:hypothetical protein Pla163_12780 [Planctomycetes bacterium Pla163]|uniref:Uncharacterized protein n=1 Tax=Rohdeia mirabilis TaxID=2528008 RepID=A0A518CY63_9BACT|nr:hypothetical protein Pla163_12780 [Planctomycetes bacterium Pla163]